MCVLSLLVVLPLLSAAALKSGVTRSVPRLVPLTRLFLAADHEREERGAASTQSTPTPISMHDKQTLRRLQGGTTLLLSVSSLSSLASSASAATSTVTTTTTSSIATSSLAALEAATEIATATATAAAETLTIPMELFDSCYCCNYTINGGASSYRAIIDTGSPFLIVPSVCTSEWGCVVDATSASDDGNNRARAVVAYERVPSLAPTIEIFGGQNYEAEWQQGDLSFVNASLHGIARRGGGVGAAKGGNLFPSVIFASVGDDVRRAPGGVFLGLIKYKQKRIRPTLMAQLAFSGFRFDPPSKLLTLSRQRPLISPRSDCVPIVDLSVLGDPVSHFAARVFRLEVNGVEIKADKTPAGLFAIFDTGTTGCTISDDLMNDAETPIPVRKVRVFLKTEQNATVLVEAEATRDEPFVVTASKIPWFQYTTTPKDASSFASSSSLSLQRDQERKRESYEEQLEREEDEQKQRLRQAPQIIVLGLIFLKSSVLTIDIEANRLQITDQKPHPPRVSPPKKIRKQ